MSTGRRFYASGRNLPNQAEIFKVKVMKVQILQILITVVELFKNFVLLLAEN